MAFQLFDWHGSLSRFYGNMWGKNYVFMKRSQQSWHTNNYTFINRTNRMILIRSRRVLGFLFLSQRPPNSFYYKTFFSFVCFPLFHEQQCTPCYCSVRANVQYSFKSICISRWECEAGIKMYWHRMVIFD